MDAGPENLVYTRFRLSGSSPLLRLTVPSGWHQTKDSGTCHLNDLPHIQYLDLLYWAGDPKDRGAGHLNKIRPIVAAAQSINPSVTFCKSPSPILSRSCAEVMQRHNIVRPQICQGVSENRCCCQHRLQTSSCACHWTSSAVFVRAGLPYRGNAEVSIQSALERRCCQTDRPDAMQVSPPVVNVTAVLSRLMSQNRWPRWQRSYWACLFVSHFVKHGGSVILACFNNQSVAHPPPEQTTTLLWSAQLLGTDGDSIAIRRILAWDSVVAEAEWAGFCHQGST